MIKFKKWLLTGLLASLALASSVSYAHPPGHGGWRGNVGVYFGSPYPFYPYPYSAYPYPYVYSPPPVIVTQPPQPQVYIEQGNGTASSTQTPAQTTAPTASTSNGNGQGYWYYCEQSDGYYPYVKECPAGWKQVTPSPPPGTSTR